MPDQGWADDGALRVGNHGAPPHARHVERHPVDRSAERLDHGHGGVDVLDLNERNSPRHGVRPKADEAAVRRAMRDDQRVIGLPRGPCEVRGVFDLVRPTEQVGVEARGRLDVTGQQVVPDDPAGWGFVGACPVGGLYTLPDIWWHVI